MFRLHSAVSDQHKPLRLIKDKVSPRTGKTRTELHPHGGDWLKQVILGLNDGLVTTLVFGLSVSGIASAHALAGALVSELAAGGCAMGLGGYLAKATEMEIIEQRMLTEQYEIRHEPAEEREELARIYRQKGLHEPLLQTVVDHLTANEERWLHAILQDEHGLISGRSLGHPRSDAFIIGGAFIGGGLFPAVPLVVFPGVTGKIGAVIAALLLAGFLGLMKAHYVRRGAFAAAWQFTRLVGIGTLVGVTVSFLLAHA